MLCALRIIKKHLTMHDKTAYKQNDQESINITNVLRSSVQYTFIYKNSIYQE